jgi:hypothetical protein
MSAHTLYLAQHLWKRLSRIVAPRYQCIWWTMYSHYGITQRSEHRSMLKLLFKLRDNDCQGPIIRDQDMPANCIVGEDARNVTAMISEMSAACRKMLQS